MLNRPVPTSASRRALAPWRERRPATRTLVSSTISGMTSRGPASAAAVVFHGRVSARGSRSGKPEHKLQSCINRVHQPRRQPPDLLVEERTIKRDELGYVDHRVLGKSRGPGGDKHIPRRLRQAHVAREHTAKHCRNPAAVECIRLHDQYGPPITRLRAARLVQVSPPYFASVNVHDFPTSPRFPATGAALGEARRPARWARWRRDRPVAT